MNSQIEADEQLVLIRERIAAGILISHILNINLTNPPPPPQTSLIRVALKDFIRGMAHTHQINHAGTILEATLRWDVPDVGSTNAYYYAVDLPYTDNIIRAHVKKMVRAAINHIRTMHPECGLEWGLAFSVLKTTPMYRMVPIAAEDV
jgi:hypothetical protein